MKCIRISYSVRDLIRRDRLDAEKQHSCSLGFLFFLHWFCFPPRPDQVPVTPDRRQTTLPSPAGAHSHQGGVCTSTSKLADRDFHFAENLWPWTTGCFPFAAEHSLFRDFPHMAHAVKSRKSDCQWLVCRIELVDPS